MACSSYSVTTGTKSSPPHYLIHSYDNPQLAQMGLPAARRYAQIAPSAPHALHMPSHIFARLGLWQDSIASNLASVAGGNKFPQGIVRTDQPIRSDYRQNSE